MNSSEFDWQELRIYLAVIRAGSLSKAAKELGISQPTVSRRMDALEKALGGPIIIRTVTGCQPTSRGAALLPMLEQMERASQGIKRVINSTNEEIYGEVKIATGELIGRLLARHSWTLLAGLPGVQLQIIAGMQEVNLERGDAHIAIRSRRPKSGNLFAKRISTTSFAIYGSPSFVEYYPQSLDERRYKFCRWGTYIPSMQHLPSSKWLLKLLSPDAPKLLFNSSGLILEASARGACLSVLPTYIGDDDSRLQQVEGPLEELNMQGWMVLHRDTRKLSHIRVIADRIAQLIADLAPYSSDENTTKTVSIPNKTPDSL